MQNQLFVGNLAFSTTKEDLEAAFAPYGSIQQVNIPIDRDTGRVRGFAFVTFDNAEAAENALKALDGTELNGRPIRVNIAQEKKSGGSGGGGGGSRGRSSGGGGGYGGHGGGGGRSRSTHGSR